MKRTPTEQQALDRALPCTQALWKETNRIMATLPAESPARNQAKAEYQLAFAAAKYREREKRLYQLRRAKEFGRITVIDMLRLKPEEPTAQDLHDRLQLAYQKLCEAEGNPAATPTERQTHETDTHRTESP